MSVRMCVFPLAESVFLLETDQPKGLLVFGVFTSTRYDRCGQLRHSCEASAVMLITDWLSAGGDVLVQGTVT